jgi:hypothetical protein
MKSSATTWILSGCLAAAAAMLSGPAGAHHSFAVYERTKVVTLKGTVKTFQWTNPHVVIWLLVTPAGGGEPEEWGLETTSPGVLTRSGWTRNSIKAGDQITAEFSPLRDGTHGGGLNSVTLASGEKLTASFASGEKAGLK